MLLDRRRILVGLLSVAASQDATNATAQAPTERPAPVGGPAHPRAARLIAAAEAQIGVTIRYDPAYVKLPNPGGDVPRDRGVCTDVVVRAYRDGFGIDLQSLVHADMRRAFAEYPRRWGLQQPDASIDHRRVPNLETYFTRRGFAMPLPRANSIARPDWQPGDIITQRLNAPGASRLGPPHIGIVSSTRDGTSGRWLVVHNIGLGTRKDDILESYHVNGHVRFLPDYA